MKKSIKLLKFSAFVGILLGVGIKVYDFVKTRSFRCGIQEAVVCNWLSFIKDTVIWAVITTIAVIIIVFGIKYLLSLVKKIKLPKKTAKKKEAKPKSEKKASKKEEKKEEPKEKDDDEEVIKI